MPNRASITRNWPPGQRPPGHWQAALWQAGLLTLVFFVLYAMAWDQDFYADDYANLLRTRGRNLIGGFFADLVANTYGTDVVYCRPGWYFLFGLLQALFGGKAIAFVAFALLLHLAMTLMVFFAARSICRSEALAFAAACFFMSSPAYVEAVMWPSAALNVLPGAILLFLAVRSYLLFVHSDERRHYVWSAVFFVGSLLFKEAAYSFPMIAASSHIFLGRKGRTARSVLQQISFVVPFVAIVVVHFQGLNKRTPFEQTFGEILQSLGHNISRNLGAVFGVPQDGWIMFAVTLPFLVVLAWLSSRRARFLMAWALLAMFPYVVVDPASRFLYFCQPPWALFFAVFIADLRELYFRRAPMWILAGALLLAAGFNAVRLPSGIRVFVEQGKICRNALKCAEEQQLGRFQRLRSDSPPPALQNSFAAMLAWHHHWKIEIQDLGVRRFGHFLIHTSREFAPAPGTDVFLTWNPDGTCATVDAATFQQGQIPVRVAALVDEYEVVPDLAMMEQRIAARSVDLTRRVLLAKPPTFPRVAAREAVQHRIVFESFKSQFRVEVEVEATRPTILVVSFPARPEELRVRVGDVEVELLQANRYFLGVPVPAGRYTVVFSRRV